MEKVIIPKNLAQQDDLVVIARGEYERLLGLQKLVLPANDEIVSEDDVLRWSQEARQAKQSGALPILNSLRDLR